MKLRRLSIERLPGIAEGFALEDLPLGLAVVVGPNASGKTSLCRAVRALLYPENIPGPVLLEAEFVGDDGTLKAVRQGGEVTWLCDGERTGGPEITDRRFAGCYTIEFTDLLSDDATDREIAERLVREMAGGYDLDSVLDDTFSTGKHHGRREAQQLREAQRELDRTRRRYQETQRREKQLDELRARLADARAAEKNAETCRRAIEWLGARRELEELSRRFAEYPTELEALRGGEIEELADLREKLSRAQRRLAAAERETIRLEQAIAELSLGDCETTVEDLEAPKSWVARMREAERHRRDAAKNLEINEQEQDAALEELGGRKPTGRARITPEMLSEIEQDLGRKRLLEGRIEAVEAELRRLPAAAGDRLQPEHLAAARSELLRWLAAPSRRTTLELQGTVVLLTAVAIAAAGVVAELADRLAWLIAAPLLAAAWYSLRGIHRRGRERDEARRRYEDSGVEPPARWKEDVVRQRLSDLDRDLAAAHEALAAAARRRQLEAELADLERQHELSTSELRALAHQVGWDPTKLDASFDRWLRLVDRYDRAREEVVRQRGELSAAREEESRLREQLSEFLSRCPGEYGEPADAEAFGACLAELERRLRERDDNRKRLTEQARERERATEEIGDLGDRIARLFENAGVALDDDAELARRVAMLGEWREARDRVQAARGRAEGAGSRASELLEQRPELAALGERGDVEALEAQLGEFERAAEAIESITRRIAEIEKEIADARRGSDLERARAARERAADCLRDCLEREWFATAGRVVLTEVEREHADESRPAMLARAAEWFARFTRHSFALEFDRRRGLYAVDTATAERRSLSELSSGTRMQLLLAARLAFTVTAEGGREPLPLFLDEVLTTTDPERFSAVATALAELCGDGGRQLFYLTAQPADVGLLERALGTRPAVIDLAAVRRLAVAVVDPAELEPPPVRRVPSPEGMSAEQYAAAVGAGKVRLLDPVESVHVLHLLHDDLGMVARLCDFGIERLGQLESLLSSPAASAVVGGDRRRDLAVRIEVARLVIDAWREGRGRPVDRNVLEAAGVSDVYLDRLASLAAEHGGDAGALISALEERSDPRTKGFRTKVIDRLREFLERGGYLDDRPRLSADEIRLRVLGALAEPLAAGEVFEDFVSARVRDLLAAVPD